MLAAALARSRFANSGTAPRYALTAPFSSAAAKLSTSACVFSVATGKSYFAFAVTGVPPSFCDGFREHVRVLLVMALERDGEIEHRLLQQAALGAHLVGGDRFVLGAERGVEDADVAGGGVAGGRGEHVAAGEERDGGAGEHSARAHEASRGGRRQTFGKSKKDMANSP